MNEELRKKNKRNNIILLVIGLVIIVAILAGFGIHSYNEATRTAAEKFAQTHFNPNVKIDGVKVGKLTVAKATDKVNKNAKNQIELKNNKLEYSYSTTIQTIDEAETRSLFKKQQTKMPSNKSYSFTTKDLATAKKKLSDLKNATIKYQINGESYDLKAKELVDNVTYRDGKYQFGDTAKLTDKLNQIDKEVSSLHKSYKFTVPKGDKVKGKTITVKNKTWGWGVYVKKARRLLLEALEQGKTTFLTEPMRSMV